MDDNLCALDFGIHRIKMETVSNPTLSYAMRYFRDRIEEIMEGENKNDGQ